MRERELLEDIHERQSMRGAFSRTDLGRNQKHSIYIYIYIALERLWEAYILLCEQVLGDIHEMRDLLRDYLLRDCVQSKNERFGVEGFIEESAKDLVLIQCVATLMDKRFEVL